MTVLIHPGDSKSEQKVKYLDLKLNNGVNYNNFALISSFFVILNVYKGALNTYMCSILHSILNVSF